MSCPQATERYKAPALCPINWANFPEIDAIQREAYEARAPWQPEFRTWNATAKFVERETGVKISDEGMRKRFRVANKIIFDATKVYFVNSGMGLEEYGYSTDTEVAKLLKKAESINNQGQNNATSKLARICQQTRSAPSLKRPKKRSSNKTDRVNIFELGECNRLLIHGSVMKVLVNPRPWDPNNNTLRYIPMQTGIEHRLPKNITEEIMPWSVTAFDLWYTIFYFKHRSGLPKRLWKVREFFPHTQPIFFQRFPYTRLAQPLVDPERLGDPQYTHEDIGAFLPSMRVLLETYCLSHFTRTQAISDMILDTIHEILIKDQQLIKKYSQGRIIKAEDDPVIRFFDLKPKDIENLWEQTDIDNAMRRLISDVLHHAEGMGEQSCINDTQIAVTKYIELYESLRRDQVIQEFAKGISRKAFCILYHHHHQHHLLGWHTKCYRSEENCDMSEEFINNANISKESQNFLDHYSKKRTFQHEGVVYTALDETNGIGLDFTSLQRKAPGWRWNRLRSVMTKATIQQDGTLRKGSVPVYYDSEDMDDYGRYPSHPGFKNPNWVHPEAFRTNTQAESFTDIRTPNIQGTHKHKGHGGIIVTIQDPHWDPPAGFADYIELKDYGTYARFQQARRTAWEEAGNEIPTITVRRFSPEKDGSLKRGKDTFIDASDEERRRYGPIIF